MEQNPKARRGYSRDGRPDCLQLVIALFVTPDGFPLANEVMNGNTADSSTLRDFLAKIETTYGKARRVWVMDRGIPSEAILKEMRQPERETFYLVGTPKGRISQHEKKWLALPWQKVRDSVEVKLYRHEGELYVLAKSSGRQAREIAMRRKRLARLLRKLRAMRKSLPNRTWRARSERRLSRQALIRVVCGWRLWKPSPWAIRRRQLPCYPNSRL